MRTSADTAAKAGEGVTRARVAQLKDAGATAREIALALGVTTQAVHYHLAKLREKAAS